jgi:hypothetical protein
MTNNSKNSPPMIIGKYNNELFNQIKIIFNETKSKIDLLGKIKIGYTNIYHNKWKINKYAFLLDLIEKETTMKKDRIVSYGFIRSMPNCDNQLFHIDYEGNVETFFIPLVDLTDDNGNEYLKFKNLKDNAKYFDTLSSINYQYIEKNDVIKALTEKCIDKNSYEFKIVNAIAGSLVHMQYFCFHRGKKNTSNKERVMFQIVILRNKNYNIVDNEVFPDAELDEQNFISKIIKNRKK